MEQITTVGIDLARSVFSLHEVNGAQKLDHCEIEQISRVAYGIDRRSRSRMSRTSSRPPISARLRGKDESG